MTMNELMNRFSKINKVKKGGQKTVFSAEEKDGTKVALKLVSDVTDPRVLQEIEIVKKLSFINVPRIIESGIVQDITTSDECLYIIEEYIDGCSLRNWINSGKKADLKYAYTILESLLNIEVILEKNNILHRDINPNNIMLGANGMIYLIDFGLAKDLEGTSLTRTAALNGPFTPGYAPNEQMMNKKMLQDVRTDLFQIGVTIYEACTGNNPFVKSGDSIQQIMSRTMTVNPPLLRLNGDSKGFFAQFVNMLMAKQQSMRPDSAQKAMEYLHTIKTTLAWEE